MQLKYRKRQDEFNSHKMAMQYLANDCAVCTNPGKCLQFFQNRGSFTLHTISFAKCTIKCFCFPADILWCKSHWVSLSSNCNVRSLPTFPPSLGPLQSLIPISRSEDGIFLLREGSFRPLCCNSSRNVAVGERETPEEGWSSILN